MTKGFCFMKKKECKDSGRFELGKFKMFAMKDGINKL